MELEVTANILWLLLAAGCLAGFVDAIAGGGGLITVTALLLTGAPPIQALATNKVQGLFGAGSAAWAYARGGHVRPSQQFLPATLSFSQPWLARLPSRPCQVAQYAFCCRLC